MTIENKPSDPQTRKTVNEQTELAGFTSTRHLLSDGRELTSWSRAGKGPALILIPGTWGDLESWAPLITRLPADRAIIVIELFWQGGRALGDGPLEIPILADAVLQVIAALQPGQFILGGISLGGMITVEIAGRNPADLIAAIPMEGWTHHSVADTAFNNLVRTALEPDQEQQRLADRRRRMAHLSAEQKSVIRTIWRRWNGTDALLRSKVPILHIWGDRNRPRPGPDALQIPERPNITVAWIAGSSHLLLIQAPDALADMVRDFLASFSSITPPSTA
ncbi:MAG: alpha/beta hydrolase [Candidatus Brocadiia bacterium]